MQKIFVTSLMLLSACGFLWSAAAQETPPAKEKAAIPFEDSKEAERPSRAQAKHRIELSQPLAADKTLEEQLEARSSFQAEEATLKSFAAALETGARHFRRPGNQEAGRGGHQHGDTAHIQAEKRADQDRP